MILREPSVKRVCCTITWMLRAICSRIACDGRSTPAMSTRVSRRASASTGEFAWMVVIEPSWPVFMAWSMSSASPPRHSPTTMRSGRIRSEFFTRSRIVKAPLPSMFACLVSSETTCGWLSWSSAASSIVTMRSALGIDAESTLRSVVFPEPVPPEMRMFFFAMTARSRNFAMRGVSEPRRMKSSTIRRRFGKRRIVMQLPRSASGRMMALTREPSARRASTSGCDSSIRRPSGVTMRSMTARTRSSSVKRVLVISTLPARST